MGRAAERGPIDPVVRTVRRVDVAPLKEDRLPIALPAPRPKIYWLALTRTATASSICRN